ncbi:MAG: class I SAM-dependent methyltransferase [Chloroflexota bacterium]
MQNQSLENRQQRQEIIQKELEWHDKEAHRRLPLDHFLYDPPAFDALSNFCVDFLQAKPGELVLDMGCGEGKHTIDLARRNLVVISVDLSHTQLLLARQMMAEQLPDAQIFFVQANAEELPFAQNSFRILFGKAIIHHLDEQLAVAEVKRLLKPNGRATFSEPLAHHPLIWLGRRLTPKLRTEDEHPLKIQEMARFGQAFGTEEVDAFFLLAPLAYVIRALPRGETAFRRIHKFLSGVDQKIFKTFRGARRLAWYGVVNVINRSS